MDWWYTLLSFLPFEWAEPGKYLFIKNALLGVIITAPLFALIGTVVVNSSMAFFSDALGHGAFAGIAAGSIFSAFFPQLYAAIFAITFAIIVCVVRYKSALSADTVIGVFSSLSVAIGLFLSTTLGGGINKLSRILTGDILSVDSGGILTLFFLLVIVSVLWCFIFNKLAISSISPLLATSAGMSPFVYETLFACICAVCVTVALPYTGLLLVNSVIVLPAAGARNIARNMRQYLLLSVIFSVFSSISGLFLAYFFGGIASASIVGILCLLFFFSFIFRKK